MRFVPGVLVAVLFVFVAGCMTAAKRAAQVEPMMGAAGFHAFPADTPEKMERLKKLRPQLQLTYSVRGGKPHYWYADPVRCKCLYIGDEAMYQKYETLRVQRDIADSERATAELEENAASIDEQMDYYLPYGAAVIWVAP